MTSREFQSQLTRRASVARIDLSAVLGEQLEAYYRLLAHWNDSINLTALPLDPMTDQAFDRLLIEPMTAARYLQTESPTWFDVGSGGGSPAIPMKLSIPGGQLTMVESKERKAAFLREAVRTLRMANTSVEAERIEAVATNVRISGTADLVTVRAVRSDPILMGAIRTLLRFGGQAIFFGVKHGVLQIPAGFEMFEPLSPSSEPSNPNLMVLNRVGV